MREVMKSVLQRLLVFCRRKKKRWWRLWIRRARSLLSARVISLILAVTALLP